MEEEKPQTALEFAASKGFINIAAQIIEQKTEDKGVNLEELNNSFQFAMKSENLDTALLLVASGVQPETLTPSLDPKTLEQLYEHKPSPDNMELIEDMATLQSAPTNNITDMKKNFQQSAQSSSVSPKSTPKVNTVKQNNSKGR